VVRSHAGEPNKERKLKMIYVGNFWKNIPSELIPALMTHPEPKYRSYDGDGEVETRVWKSLGYDLEVIRLYHIDYDKVNVKFKLPDLFDDIIEIWFTKYMPGDMLPYHQDGFTFETDGVTRYVMMLQDVMPGHIFAYNNEVLTGYRAGDVFRYPDKDIWHGACNIGLTPRLTMQICSRHTRKNNGT
jgi:hypothetical protein